MSSKAPGHLLHMLASLDCLVQRENMYKGLVLSAAATRLGSAQLNLAPLGPNWDEWSGARPWLSRLTVLLE